MRRPVSIAPPKGKLGVLTPGMGAVEHDAHGGRGIGAARGIACRWVRSRRWARSASGKRTENRVPKIKEFVQLAELEDLVFGGWDIFPDDAYQAASKAGVLDAKDLAKAQKFLKTIKPMKAAFDQNYVKKLQRHERQEGQDQVRSRRADSRGHPQLQKEEQARPAGDGLVRVHRSIPEGRRQCTRIWRRSKRR